MATESDIEEFLKTATTLDENAVTGEVGFDPTGGEGGIPKFTVQGEESILGGVLPGTESLLKRRDEKKEQVLVEGEVITTESGFDTKSGLPTLTAGTKKKLIPKGETLLERALGTTPGIAAFAVLETFGIPTRALGATVRNANPFASAEDKGKTWDEVFADPQSGIFKEVRKIIRNSDMNGATKFLLEMGVSVVEDPLVIVSGLIGVGKSAIRQTAAKKAAKRTDTSLKIPDTAQRDLLLPAGKVEQRFTPAQKEFVATGKVTRETAKKEQTAIKNAPEVKREIDAGRSDNVVNSIQGIRERNGLTNTEGVALFEAVEGDVGKAIATYKTEVSQLYKGVNDVADPSIIGKQTKDVVSKEFSKFGIKAKPGSLELDVLSRKLIKEAQDAGVLLFKADKSNRKILRPFNSKTNKFLDSRALKDSLTLGANDLGISPTAFGLLHKVRNSLQRDVTLGVLRKNKTTLSNAAIVARRSGDNASASMMEQGAASLKNATRTQIDDVIGNPRLTDEWMLADDFLTQNASGVKAAGGLMYDKAGNPRSVSAIIREFNKVPTGKKGRVIDAMLDFFDESGMQNLRNLYFNDIIERASKGGFSGQKLRNVINSQPEGVFNKVFTQGMKDDMSQLLADAISDDLGKMLTRAKLGTFSAADKQSFIKTIFGNPAYRIWATTAGFTKASLKRLSFLATAGIISSSFQKKAVRSAASFLKGTDQKGLTGLTFKAFQEGTEAGLSRGAVVTPTVIQRNLNPDLAPASTGTSDTGIESEIDKLLQGL